MADRDEGCDACDAPGVDHAPSDLGWYLGVILRRWTEEVSDAVGAVPHGTRGFQILTAVARNGPPTQSALARHLRIDKTVMPYVIDALEEAGLVERQVDPADRRVRRIALTAHGSTTLADLEAKVRAAEDEVFAGVPAAERDRFADLAADLATRIHGVRPAVDPCTAVADVMGDASLGRPS